MKELKALILAVSVSLVVSASIVSVGLSKIARPDRTVTVRGLAEKEVDADLALWPLTFTLGANSLTQLQKDILAKTQTVKEYLADHGLSEEDYTVQSPSITDNTINPYMDRDKIPCAVGGPRALVKSR